MMKVLLSGAVVAGGACWPGSAPARSAKKYIFALVPKNMNNPFFDQARDGCKKAEKELERRVRMPVYRPRRARRRRGAGADRAAT